MSNQDSGDRKPFGRLAQALASESGYKTKKESDETPPVVTGRGRMLAALAVKFLFFFSLFNFILKTIIGKNKNAYAWNLFFVEKNK